MRLSQFVGCIAMLIELWSLIGVAAVPFSPAEWGAHSAITGVFFVSSCFDLILRLVLDRRIASLNQEKQASSCQNKLGRFRQLLACSLVLPVTGLVTGGLLLLSQTQLYVAFLLTAVGEVSFSTCLMLFHATDYWLVTTLELRTEVATPDMHGECRSIQA